MKHFSPSNLTLERRIRLREVYISKTLAEYFSAILLNGKFDFLPNGVTYVSISDVRKLGGSTRAIGNDVYSFLLTYQDGGYEQRINLILKTYGKSLDPVLKTFANYNSILRQSYTYPRIYLENLERCVKEFQVLRGLEHVGFPVPRAYLCERDSNVLGYPFIIMQKVEPIQNSTVHIDCFAKNLARLHSLDVATLGIDALKAPEDTYAFAWQCLLYFKIFLNLSPRHSKGLKKDFEFAIRWLESNVSNTRCPNYCLLHGDYRARNNTILTKGSRMVVMDWESAEIGDPAYDVGYAYTRMRADLGEKTADRFVQEYLRYSNGDVAERLLFYKLVGYLREAIIHSAVLSNPLRVYEIRGINAFLSSPFLRLPFIAKMMGADLDVRWVDLFKEFVRENLKR
jgi:aminoglycoside phosphotransferase (APT) family kinase protein